MNIKEFESYLHPHELEVFKRKFRDYHYDNSYDKYVLRSLNLEAAVLRAFIWTGTDINWREIASRKKSVRNPIQQTLIELQNYGHS